MQVQVLSTLTHPLGILSSPNAAQSESKHWRLRDLDHEQSSNNRHQSNSAGSGQRHTTGSSDGARSTGRRPSGSSCGATTSRNSNSSTGSELLVLGKRTTRVSGSAVITVSFSSCPTTYSTCGETHFSLITMTMPFAQCLPWAQYTQMGLVSLIGMV